MKRFLRNYRLSIPTVIVLIAVSGWVVFGFFGAHLLFVDDEVNEAVPTFAAPSTTAQPKTPALVPTISSAVANVPAEPVPAELAPPATGLPATGAPTTLPATTLPATGAPTTVPATGTPTTLPPAPVIVTEASGAFESRGHDTSGNASVLGDGSGQRFLRFENFATSNGPDLNVYLVNSNAGGISDSVDLGNLKGNAGDQNYEIPVGTDLAVHDTVVVWCVRFAYSFGQATLHPA